MSASGLSVEYIVNVADGWSRETGGYTGGLPPIELRRIGRDFVPAGMS